MATYNGARYLREQMDSIIGQMQPEDELIISDDHSTDDTRNIVASYDDARIRLISNPGKRGHVRNFAHAMSHATGEFIALSDQDDVWVENRLTRMLDHLRRIPKCVLVVGDFTEFDGDGMPDLRTPLGPSPVNGLVGLVRIFLGRAKYFGCTFLFRRDLTRYVLPIPAGVEAHDIWIAMNACLRGGVVHLESTVLMRRLHGNNLSPQRHRGLRKVVRSRLYYLAGLLQSSIR